VALDNSTNGAGWTNHSEWLTTGTPCSWYGVACDTGHVYALAVGSNQLSGSIPPELGNLANLQNLNLAFNQLRGPLPQSLTNLHALGYFQFDTGLLCVPDNAAFAAWLANIPDRSTGSTTCKTGYLPALWH
jgi:hypothetical protein